MRFIRLVATGLSLIALCACSKNQKQEKSARPADGSLIRTSSTNAQGGLLWDQIASASPSTALLFLERMHEFDPVSQPDFSKDEEFETTAQRATNARAVYKKAHTTYDHRCLATISRTNFQYDADLSEATFFGDFDVLHENPVSVMTYDNVKFVDGRDTKDQPIVAHLAVDDAKRLRRAVDQRDIIEDKGELNIVRIFSLEGRQQPVVSSWFQSFSDPFDHLNPMGADFDTAQRTIRSTSFSLAADMILVEVVSKAVGGFQKPIFVWRGAKSVC